MSNVDKQLEDILVFVDRNGFIKEKRSTNNSCSLKMKYDKGDLNIDMHAYAHGMGNGSCGATVKYNGKVVYKASGSFTARPYNSKVDVYIPGDWEELVKVY